MHEVASSTRFMMWLSLAALFQSRRGRWCFAFVTAAAAGVADAGGAAPLGEDFGLGAEAVADGGVEAFDEGPAFFDEEADLGCVAHVGESVEVRASVSV